MFIIDFHFIVVLYLANLEPNCSCSTYDEFFLLCLRILLVFCILWKKAYIPSKEKKLSMLCVFDLLLC